MQFQFQVNNAFDKAYQSNLSRLKYFEYYSSSTSGHYGMFNMGRNICLKAILPFWEYNNCYYATLIWNITVKNKRKKWKQIIDNPEHNGED